MHNTITLMTEYNNNKRKTKTNYLEEDNLHLFRLLVIQRANKFENKLK